jgi:uncharacterized protein (DUF58 family)
MLLFTLFLLILAAVIESLSLKDRLKFVRYSSEATKLLVEPEESFDVVSVTQNLSRLPLSYIELEERLPSGIKIELDSQSRYFGFSQQDSDRSEPRLKSSLYLWPRQKVERRIPVSLLKRGRYLLRGAKLQCGDFFGFSKTTRSYDQLSEIVVMPSRADNTPEFTALGNFLGDVSVRRFIMEDPVLTQGFREYSGREPQKAISWKQSARLGRLIVKQYDYTLEPSVTVLLNVHCGNETVDEELIERCFSLARTVCEALESKRIKYGFITNATTAGALGLWSSVAEGLGENHLSAILEGLGRATYGCTVCFEAVVERAVRMAEKGRSHVIITPFEYDGLTLSSKRLRAITGGEVLIISAVK